jgi:hypothetical protein
MAEETQKIQTSQKEKPHESTDMGLDDEETEQDRTSRQSRSGGRGKTPRRILEESVHDPYCE